MGYRASFASRQWQRCIVDPETEYRLQSSGLMVFVAAITLGGIYWLSKLAGIRTHRDLADVEKIVRFILLLLNTALTLAAGLAGTMGTVLVVAFCDNAPPSACLTVAGVVMLVSGLLVTLSALAIRIMVRNDDQAVWYLYFYPIPLFMFANVMLVMMPDVDFVWFGVMSMSLLAMLYALAIRKPRHPVAAARPHAVPRDDLR